MSFDAATSLATVLLYFGNELLYLGLGQVGAEQVSAFVAVSQRNIWKLTTLEKDEAGNHSEPISRPLLGHLLQQPLHDKQKPIATTEQSFQLSESAS
jgi:hypothetical protein